MKLIEDYIQLPQEDRQSHLRLDEPCIERGGNSTTLKGLMAHIHETTIPSGKKIHVCHACHNAKCSNPNHLYWGTARENRMDSIADGNLGIWENMVAKYGLEGAKAINRRNSDPSKAGKGNLGTTKSEEHKKKISEAIKMKHKENPEYAKNAGRNPAMDTDLLIDVVKQMGFKDAAKYFGLTVDQVKGRYYRAFNSH